MEPLCASKDCENIANSARVCAICKSSGCCSKFCSKDCYTRNYKQHKKIHFEDCELKRKSRLHRHDEIMTFAPYFYEHIMLNPLYKGALEKSDMGCNNVMHCLATLLVSQEYYNAIERWYFSAHKAFPDTVISLRHAIRKTCVPTVYTCFLNCSAGTLNHCFTIVQDLTPAGIWSFRLYQAYTEGQAGACTQIYTIDDWLGDCVDKPLRNEMDANMLNEELLIPIETLMSTAPESADFEMLWRQVFGGFGSSPGNRPAKFKFWSDYLELQAV